MEFPILGHCEFFCKIEESFDITKRKISSNFVAFLEYFNVKSISKSPLASHSQLRKNCLTMVFLHLASQSLRLKDQVASTWRLGLVIIMSMYVIYTTYLGMCTVHHWLVTYILLCDLKPDFSSIRAFITNLRCNVLLESC